MSIINDNIKAAINIIANGGWRGLQNGNGLNPAAKRIRNGDYVGMFNEMEHQAQIEKENRIREAEKIRQQILLNNKLQWELEQKQAAAKKLEEQELLQQQMQPYMPTNVFNSEDGTVRSEGYTPSEPLTSAVTAAAGPGYLGSLMASAVNAGNQLANLQKQQPDKFEEYMAAAKKYSPDVTRTLYSETGDKPDYDPETLREASAAAGDRMPADILAMSGAEADPFYNIVYKPNYIAEQEYKNRQAQDLFNTKEGIKQDNKLEYATAQNNFRIGQQNNSAANKQKTNALNNENKKELETHKANLRLRNTVLSKILINKAENNLTAKKDKTGKIILNSKGQLIQDKDKAAALNAWKEQVQILTDKKGDTPLTLEDQYEIGKQAAEIIKAQYEGFAEVILGKLDKLVATPSTGQTFNTEIANIESLATDSAAIEAHYSSNKGKSRIDQLRANYNNK